MESLFPREYVVARLINIPDEKKGKEEIRELMRPLTTSEELIVANFINSEIFPFPLKKGDMTALSNPKSRIGIDVIMFYTKNYLTKRDEIMCAEIGRKGSHFYNTMIMTAYFDKKHVFRERMMTNVPGRDIFKLKYLFFPININNNHWTLIVVYMEEKRISYYD